MPTCYGVRRMLTPGFPDRRTSELAPSFAAMEARRAAEKLGSYSEGREGWTGWEEVRSRVYTVEQEVRVLLTQPGQTIFVPSNWYHEVENLTDCLSVRCKSSHSLITIGATR